MRKPPPPRRPGRPRLAPTSLARSVLVTLDDATIARARSLGGGNLSAGIRAAVAAASGKR